MKTKSQKLTKVILGKTAPMNWTAWIRSEEGQRCAEITTLNRFGSDNYLENRLWTAFVAGAKYERLLHGETI